MVTECSIPPNGTFTYRIPMVQAGTYWIHSHYKAQTSDGLRTALIVRNPNDYYKYDEDIILPMSDWFREPANTIIKQFSSPDPNVRYKPMIPYGIIGGECLNAKVIKFVKNKTYRLRLLNIGASFEFHFSIDDHELRIIEVDGVPVKEKPTKGVMLAAGQRVSVLVRSKETADNNYLFHADMFTDLFTMPKYNPLNFTGVLEYAPKAPLKREVNGGWKITSDLDLEPLDGEALMDPTIQVTLDAYSGVFDDQSFRHSFNNVTFILPEVPTLLTALSTGDNANKREVYGRQSNTYVLNMGDVVEITLNNHDYYTHPFHLHGHVFQIVEIGALRSGLHRTKLARDAPVKRDTFILRGGHYAVLRFRANNPGAWLFHCHIEYHAIRGLELTF
ncbi:ferroxidase fet3, partial [Linderina pennispora]